MLFSSIPFLFYFLPATLLLYFAVPERLRNGVLLVASLLFYGWGEPRYLVVMLVTITQGYLFGRLIQRYSGQRRSKLCLAASVLLSLGVLAYCKYADFFLETFNQITGLSLPLLRVALPVGISFYTFQILSYVVDVYRQEVKAQRNFVDLATYIAMFPQLIAGPIVRYSHIARQLKERTYCAAQGASGVRRFVVGLAKKVLLANVLGELVAQYKGTQTPSVLFVWLYAVAFLLQIYFDFSGYSDMAIGLGRILGFHFPENFRYPYVAASITEFWRRWHISLSSWFRDYLYIPLGGNRVSKPRWVCNLLLVWMATGLWHGASWNFVLWGLLFALLLLVEKLWLLPKLERAKGLCHLYVLFFVLIGFVLFDGASLSQVGGELRAMFGASDLPLVTEETLYYARSYGVVLLAALVGATPGPARWVEAIRGHRLGKRILVVLEPVGITALLVVCTGYLVDGSFNPFLYFRF